MTNGSDPPPSQVTNVVHGDNYGVQAGTIHGGVHYYQSARPAVDLPYRAGITPLRAASFQDRGAAQLVAGMLDRGDTVVLTSDGSPSTSVLSGLGGVGKTQLAVDYAERLWSAHEVELLVWVTADSREAIVSSYDRLAADLTGVEDPEPVLGAQRLLEWLAGASVRWLVVLDDLQSPRDLSGLWPPTTPTGRVVVTTRRRDAALHGHRRQLIEIGVFTPTEAHAYLHAALADQPHLLNGAAELARELGYLPLALAQAAAYLLDRGLSCTDYRARLADRQRQLSSLLPDVEGLPDQHQKTVAATWSLSVEHANQLTPVGVAGPMLELASLLDANGIPAEVFGTTTVQQLLTDRAGRVVSEEDARDGLGCLHRLSLITLDPRSPSRAVQVHALVQRATRDSITEDRLSILARVAADALLQAWPDVERDTQLTHALRANTDAVATAGGDHLWEPDGHLVLFRAGHSLGESGLAAEAVDYFQRLRATSTRRLGPDHPATLRVRRNIAYWRGEAGDPAGAVAAFEELLTDRVRILGP
ncbi:tetratricopeptide repeat protein, partial [Kutzneria buriramensis]